MVEKTPTEELDTLKKTLAGLEIDVEDLPGYMVPFIFALIALEIGSKQISNVVRLPQPLLQVGLIALSGIVALVAYEAGGFWDDAFFDPRYRPPEQQKPKGSWLDRPGHPYFFFPNGDDLVKARKNATDTLKPSGGLYRAAEKSARSRHEWGRVKGVLALSKMARSLILPSFALALVMALASASSGVNRPMELLGGAIVMVIFGIGLLVVYVRKRVDHMIQLYDLAAPPPKPRARRSSSNG